MALDSLKWISEAASAGIRTVASTVRQSYDTAIQAVRSKAPDPCLACAEPLHGKVTFCPYCGGDLPDLDGTTLQR